MNDDLARATLMLVGCGAMGSALLGAWLQQDGLFKKILVVTPHQDRVVPFQQDSRVHWFAHPEEVNAQPDIILFAVKPQILPQIIPLYQRFLAEQPLILTIVAGLELAFYEHTLPGVSVIRIMPNLPVMVRQGMSALCGNVLTKSVQRQQAEVLMQQVGQVIWVENDQQIDIVTAISGCGPAYVYLLAEALERGAEHLGIDVEKSALLARQTIVGAARYLETSEQSAQDLRRQVTSPGGMTEAAIASLQQNRQFDKIFLEALQAAIQRAAKLREKS